MQTTVISKPRLVNTVLGPVSYDKLGITDAHNHVWIDSIPGAHPESPVLNLFDPILAELTNYRKSGGESILDCQPGGCGRDGNVLVRLSERSEVNIVASTGFHRKKYYPPDYWLFNASEGKAVEYFIAELTMGMEETINTPKPALAGFIKIALGDRWSDCPQNLLRAVAETARQTWAIVEIHTEKGILAERSVIFFEDLGITPSQLVLCHMDKRPDFVLHADLARNGLMLEYDTFFRLKYDPETNLWPLIQEMVEAGMGSQIALATDMADSGMYKFIGKGPGLASFPCQIKARLRQMGVHEDVIRQLLGENIAQRLIGQK
jgi:predicted metal-dependent phosphotriesterase family hydrolase